MVQILELIGNKKLLHLLIFLASHPSSEYSYTELRKKTNLAKATLSKWLSYLRKEHIIQEKAIGRNKLYQIDQCSAIIKQFKILITLASLDFFLPLSEKYSIRAYLYGSAARGEEVESSDIDILIIGKVKKEEIISEIQKQSSKLKKPIKIQIFTSLEWANMAEKDKAFYERMEKDKILLC